MHTGKVSFQPLYSECESVECSSYARIESLRITEIAHIGIFMYFELRKWKMNS